LSSEIKDAPTTPSAPSSIIPVDLIPLDAADRITRALRIFEKVTHDALRSCDFATIQGKRHIKKSGCSLLAAVCNISAQKMDEEREDRPSGERLYHFTYRAIGPGGRFMDAVGSASTKEKQFTHVDHDARTLAQTRAYNRCILNLAAAGEVSAEEMVSDIAVEVEAHEVESKEPSPEPASHDMKSTQQVTTPSQQKPTTKETPAGGTPADRPTQVEGWEVPVSIETPTIPGLEREIIKRDGHNVGTRLILDDEAAFIVARPVDPKDSALTTFLQNQILEAMKGKHPSEFQYQYVVENGLFHGLLVRAKDRKEILSLGSPVSWAFLKVLSRETKKGAA
jgi:hypothetical protein